MFAGEDELNGTSTVQQPQFRPGTDSAVFAVDAPTRPEPITTTSYEVERNWARECSREKGGTAICWHRSDR